MHMILKEINNSLNCRLLKITSQTGLLAVIISNAEVMINITDDN